MILRVKEESDGNLQGALSLEEIIIFSWFYEYATYLAVHILCWLLSTKETDSVRDIYSQKSENIIILVSFWHRKIL